MLTHRSPRTPLAPVRRRLAPVLVALLASLSTAPALAQDDAARILVEQGNHWLSRGDFKRAAEAWNKLLMIDANHVQALHGLGMIEVESGRPDSAQTYLARLQAHHPNAAQTTRLRQAIQVGPRRQVLEQARQQVQRGQTEQAVANYQAVLGDVPPDGPLALEYYQTLGGSPEGWEEARRGFERLAKASPNDPVIALALAQHLTYREATRRQGIEQLSKLASRADVGQAASSSWRKALVWSGSRPTDAPLYQAYLQRFPDDADIRNKLAQIRRDQQQQREQAAQAARKRPADPVRQQVTDGFAAFDEGNLQQAENLFSAALKARPNDGDAQGGMGIIRLRQERFSEAKTYLEQASKRGSASRWRAALNSASYWSLIEQAEASRAQGNLNAAKQQLQQAIKLDPNTPTAQIALGDTLAELGELDQAEATYRRVTQRQPDNPDALRGLVGIMAQNNKPDEALALVERLTPAQQEQIGELGRLRAAQALGMAKAASQRGDDAGARVALEDALLNDPNSPWIRLDLARLYMKMGAYRDARGVMDGLLVSNPDFPDALYASALLSSEMQDWSAALSTLEQIPMANRTREMAALHQRSWVHVQAQRARALAQEGYQQEALQLLTQIEPYGQESPELLGTIAMAYTDSGNSAKALSMIRQIMARTARPDVGMRLQYASILLSTGQDIELAGVLRQLQNAQMSDSQYQDFDKLRRAYIVRQADALRTSGDLVMAYDTLAPVLATHPDDPDVVGALARMYADANDYPQALTLYRRLLNNNPTDLDLLVPAASMATSAKEYNLAESMLKEALTLAPHDPKALTAAGHLYRAQGKSSKAAEYFSAAVQAEQRQRQQALGLAGLPAAAPATAAAASNNPFASRQAGTAAPQAVQQAAVPIPFTAQPVSQVHVPGTPAQNFIPDPAGARRFAPQTPTQAQPQAAPAPMYGAPAGLPAQTAPHSIPAPYPGAAPSAAPRNAPATRGTPAQRNTLASPAMRSASLPPADVALSGAPQSASTGLYPDYLAASNAPQSPASTALSELQAIQQERSPSITVGGTVRSRSGESGLGKLTDLQTPIEASLPVGDGRIAVRATPVMLDAGRVPDSYDVSSRFGAGPVAAVDQEFGLVGGAGRQDQSGVGLSVGYAGNWGEVDVGTTPLGFRKTDITGGVKFRAPLSTNLSLSADLSRRPVTDSLLSFAGARDARTGDQWGMVSATGGRVELGWDDQTYGLYGYGAYHALRGDNVASNTRMEAGAGMYWRLIDRPGQELKAGLNLTGMSFDKNLRYFTYGHGGYFSPQTFVSMSVPVSWAHRNGRLSYLINGAVGVQHFKEDSAPYFPTNGSRQAAAEQAVTTANAFGLTGNTSARYAGQSKTGLGYNLNAAMEYQVAPQLFLGGQLALDNARDYNQWLGGVYLRYMFDPQTKPMRFPLSPFRSPYQLQ